MKSKWDDRGRRIFKFGFVANPPRAEAEIGPCFGYTPSASRVLAMLLLLSSSAHAFCGAFVGSAGSALENAGTVVVLAQDAGRTTLTLVPDVQGNVTEFGVVIPVPAGLSAASVRSAGGDALGLLDRYSVPRGVAYTCDSLWTASASSGSGCASPLGGEEAAATEDVSGARVDARVAVHAAFTVGVYELALVSAEDAGGLSGWLDTQGWSVPAGGEALLASYVDSGSWFLTARVALDGVPAERTDLTPLQIAYDGETWLLPIRLGTLSAAAEQEVVILAVADEELGISNFPEMAVETECMWRGDDLDAAYEAQIDAAVVDAGGAGWIREYSWTLATKCDPCTTEQPIDAESLASIGYSGTAPHLTRLRLRYDSSTVTEDVALYPTGRVGVTDQVRFVRYDEALEDWFPVCDEGWADDPGTCPDVVGAGCTTPVVPASGLVTLLALAMLRRRR